MGTFFFLYVAYFVSLNHVMACYGNLCLGIHRVFKVLMHKIECPNGGGVCYLGVKC